MALRMNPKLTLPSHQTWNPQPGPSVAKGTSRGLQLGSILVGAHPPIQHEPERMILEASSFTGSTLFRDPTSRWAKGVGEAHDGHHGDGLGMLRLPGLFDAQHAGAPDGEVRLRGSAAPLPEKGARYFPGKHGVKRLIPRMYQTSGVENTTKGNAGKGPTHRANPGKTWGPGAHPFGPPSGFWSSL